MYLSKRNENFLNSCLVKNSSEQERGIFPSLPDTSTFGVIFFAKKWPKWEGRGGKIFLFGPGGWSRLKAVVRGCVAKNWNCESIPIIQQMDTGLLLF